MADDSDGDEAAEDVQGTVDHLPNGYDMSDNNAEVVVLLAVC